MYYSKTTLKKIERVINTLIALFKTIKDEK